MNKILVETSARHVHVTQETLEILFGKGHELTIKKYLSQPGQFASEEKVDVVGPKNTISRVSILGPVRKANQVDVQAPVRESGDIAGSAAVKLVGPCGEVELAEGCIAAKRHIHLTPEDAKEYGLENGQIVSVVLNDTARPLIFGDVVVRVSEKFSAAMHIDTDESNAACASGTVYGEIFK